MIIEATTGETTLFVTAPNLPFGQFATHVNTAAGYAVLCNRFGTVHYRDGGEWFSLPYATHLWATPIGRPTVVAVIPLEAFPDFYHAWREQQSLAAETAIDPLTYLGSST